MSEQKNQETRNEAPPPPPNSTLKPTIINEGFTRGSEDNKNQKK